MTNLPKTLLADEEIKQVRLAYMGKEWSDLERAFGYREEWTGVERFVAKAQDAKTKRETFEYLYRNLKGCKHLTIENLLNSTFWLEFKKWALGE